MVGYEDKKGGGKLIACSGEPGSNQDAFRAGNFFSSLFTNQSILWRIFNFWIVFSLNQADSGIGVQFWLENTTMPPSVTEMVGGNWKQGIVTPPCKLSYQERGQILHVSVFLEAFAGAQCSLYSPASQRILGLIGLSRFARLCPKWNRAVHSCHFIRLSTRTWKIRLLANFPLVKETWSDVVGPGCYNNPHSCVVLYITIKHG